MDILDYISDLLYDNDCVIVPGLGGFVSHYKPASLNGGVYIAFAPPSKNVLFNAKLAHNDGLLADYLAVQRGISFNEANEQLRQSVRQVKSSLKKGDKIKVQGVGTLHINASNSIEFEPSSGYNLLADSYGLPSFSVYSLSHDDARRKGTFAGTVSVRRLAVKKYARRAVFIAPALLLLAIAPTIYYSRVQQSSMIGFGDNFAKQNKATAFDSSSQANGIATVMDEQTCKKNALAYVEPTYRFSVVVGCFKNDAAAQKLSSRLSQAGFSPEVFEKDGFFRVSLASYDSRNTAKAELSKIRQSNHEFADAWVMKRQN